MKEGHWDYTNPVQILFGPGRLAELPSLVEQRRSLLVTTPGSTSRGLTQRVTKLLGEGQLRVLDNVLPNPDLRDIQNQCTALINEPVELIVGLGGGSALDTAKVISWVLSAGAPESLRAHFEDGADLPRVTPLPVIAIPTTAGTGSEVTPSATVWNLQLKKKYSLATPDLYPQVALLDPTLTLSLPRELTITTGLDALSQAFEAIWNRNASAVTTALALRAITLAFDTLPKLVDALDSLENRSRMMEASLLAGLAISRTRTALAHAMSYPLTANYGMPHGLACSFTLPALLEFNAQADDGRLAESAQRLGYGSVPALQERLEQFLNSLGVDALTRKYVRSLDDLVSLATQMLTADRKDNNLRTAEVDDVKAILKTAWRTVSPD